jgi:hypothetical protein
MSNTRGGSWEKSPPDKTTENGKQVDGNAKQSSQNKSSNASEKPNDELFTRRKKTPSYTYSESLTMELRFGEENDKKH